MTMQATDVLHQVTVGGRPTDQDDWLRVALLGDRGRSVQVRQLAEIMADDHRWPQLIALIGDVT